MTSACAIAQFAYRVLRHTTDLGMRTRFVVAGVTARTVGSIGGVLPGGRIGIGGVTAGAAQGQARAVITGILSRCMFKSQRRPGSDGVTDIAIATSGHVANIFTGGCAAIVTSSATTGDASMTKRRRLPG